jgi:hypothetical protein
MRVLASALCFATGLAACGGAIASGTNDGGSGSSSGSSSSSSGTIVGGSSGVVGGSSGPGSGSSSGPSGGSTSSTSSGGGVSSGGVVDAMTTGCAVQPDEAPPCNQCITGSCEDGWCPCADDSSVDDAGNINGCLGYVECIIVCVDGDPDAGIGPGTLPQCAMACGPAYTKQQQAEGQAFLSCLASSCDTPTTCGPVLPHG